MLRPIGSIWEWDDGSLWQVTDHYKRSTNVCTCLPGSASPDSAYYKRDYYMGIGKNDTDWKLYSPQKQSKPFTEEEYEELLV